MAKFRQIEAKFVAPFEKLLIPSTCWNPRWDKRPLADVVCGLRPVSAANNDWCRRAASRFATTNHPPQNNPADLWVESYNNAFMRYRVLMGTCDPNDVRIDWSLWENRGEDNIHEFLVEEGVSHIYDALLRVEVACSQTRAEATDDEIEELVALAPSALRGLPEAKAQRLRRLLHFVFEELHEG